MNEVSKRTPLHRKLAFMVSGLLVGVMLCEVILRIQEPFLHIMARHFTAPYPSIAHPVWDHYPPPDISVTIAADDLEPYEFFTNSLGCRHPQEVAVPKPSDITRVLVLGDSFTEGYRYEDTGAPRLEQHLNRSLAGQQFEVINCGATTYSPILHYLRLKNQLLSLEPDYIILNIDQTDIYDDYWRYRPKYKVDTNGDPLSIGSDPPSNSRREVKDWIKKNSYLMRFASGIRSRLFIEPQQRAKPEFSDMPPSLPENVFSYQASLSIDSEEWKTQVGFCLSNIARVIKLCKQRGIPITITMYPHKQQIRADVNGVLWNREFERRTEQLCREHGVNFYSAYDGLAQAFNEGQPIFREKDIHFTNLGQRIWGDLISNYFSEVLRTKAVQPPQNSSGSTK